MSFSIDQLVADCVEAVENTNGHSGPAIEEVLARTINDPAAIEAALGHPRDMPEFSTWHNTDELTILHVVWPPSVDLMPHNHLMWASIGLYGGREDNRVFRSLPDGSLEHRRTKTLLKGDTILLGDETVHSVSNPSKEWTGAIHVYGGDFFRDGRQMWADEDQQPAPFDADVLRATLADAAAAAKLRESS